MPRNIPETVDYVFNASERITKHCTYVIGVPYKIHRQGASAIREYIESNYSGAEETDWYDTDGEGELTGINDIERDEDE